MIWILVKYADGTGATTECDAPNARTAIDLMGMFFARNMDMAYHDGAGVAEIKAIDPHDPSDCAEIRF